MAKIAAKIVAQMTDAEVEAVVTDHYRAEAQTLGTAAAWNLARLVALRDPSTETEAAVAELRNRLVAERADANPITQVKAGLTGIEDALRQMDGPLIRWKSSGDDH